MVTTEELRSFAADCLRWAGEAGNPSDREIISHTARMWTATASLIERRLSEGYQLACADLRTKLD